MCNIYIHTPPQNFQAKRHGNRKTHKDIPRISRQSQVQGVEGWLVWRRNWGKLSWPILGVAMIERENECLGEWPRGSGTEGIGIRHELEQEWDSLLWWRRGWCSWRFRGGWALIGICVGHRHWSVLLVRPSLSCRELRSWLTLERWRRESKQHLHSTFPSKVPSKHTLWLTVVLKEGVEAVEGSQFQISMVLSEIASQQWYTVRLCQRGVGTYYVM